MKEAPHSLLDTDRIGSIRDLLQSVNNLEGNIAEVGCYKGGIGHYLNLHSNGKVIYLFDTFEGIPMKGKLDSHVIGDFNDTSFEKVKEHFSDNKNVMVVKGVFPNSAKGIIGKFEQFCFVHLDADQYESTKKSLEYFYPRMVGGGIVVFDDWKWLEGATAAITNFFKDKPENITDSVMHQCYIIKK